MVPRTVMTLMLVATLPAGAATAEEDAAESFLWRPISAVILDEPAQNGDAVIAWTPGPVPADEYDIHGITDDGARVHLVTVAGDQSTADVPSGYELYGVTATRNGIAAPMKVAFSPDCLRVETGPPPDAGVDTCAAAVA